MVEILIIIEIGLKKMVLNLIVAQENGPVHELPIENAEEFASYCRKYGLTFERSDRMISQFDYADYLWDGQRDDFMQSYETVNIPQPKNKR